MGPTATGNKGKLATQKWDMSCSSLEGKFNHHTHTIHGTLVYLPIHEWLMFMVFMYRSIYNRPMDPSWDNMRFD